MVGSKIYELRKQKGVTQEEFANYLGVSPQAVSKWEKEINSPDLELITKIAKYFNISIDDLFGISRQEESKEEFDEQKINERIDDFFNNKSQDQANGFTSKTKYSAVIICDGQIIAKSDSANKEFVINLEHLPVNMSNCDFECNCSLNVKGNINGNATANNNLNCGSIGGNVSVGNGLNCGSIGGSASVGDSLNCGSIGGSASAGDSLRCGNVGGNVSAGDSVTCGDVKGDVKATDRVSAKIIEGDVYCKDGKVKCDKIYGQIIR